MLLDSENKSLHLHYTIQNIQDNLKFIEESINVNHKEWKFWLQTIHSLDMRTANLAKNIMQQSEQIEF